MQYPVDPLAQREFVRQQIGGHVDLCAVAYWLGLQSRKDAWLIIRAQARKFNATLDGCPFSPLDFIDPLLDGAIEFWWRKLYQHEFYAVAEAAQQNPGDAIPAAISAARKRGSKLPASLLQGAVAEALDRARFEAKSSKAMA